MYCQCLAVPVARVLLSQREFPVAASFTAARTMSTSVARRDIDTATKYMGGIGDVSGALVIGYARNPSLKQKLFSYAILGFALFEDMGLFRLTMGFHDPLRPVERS